MSAISSPFLDDLITSLESSVPHLFGGKLAYPDYIHECVTSQKRTGYLCANGLLSVQSLMLKQIVFFMAPVHLSLLPSLHTLNTLWH